jgi:hypothetical protein
MAMFEMLQGMGFGEDFRSTAFDLQGHPNEMSEMALAHAVSAKVEAAYRRGDMREKRRRLMVDWAAYCESAPVSDRAKVMPIRA